jgi:hypothetical protein
MTEITAQDRELLAGEYEAAGAGKMGDLIAARIRAGTDPSHDIAIRAISKLRSQLEEVTRERDSFKAKAEDWDILRQELDDANSNYKNLYRDMEGDLALLRLAADQDAYRIQEIEADRTRLTDLLRRAGEFTGQFVDRAIQRPDYDGERMGYRYSLARHPFANVTIDDVKSLHSDILAELEGK